MTTLRWLACVDIAIVALWWYEGEVVSPLLGLLHLGITLAAAGVVWRGGFGWTPWHWHGLALPLGVVLGVPGIVILFWIRPWRRGASRRLVRPASRRPGEPQRARESSDEVARMLDGRVCIPKADKVEPLCTVLRHGTLERRCAALQAVVRSFEPGLTPLVAIALADPDQTVRALAAATSAQVSANLAARIAHMEAEASPSVEDRYEYAMLLFDHACRNVLLSRSQAGHLRQNARVGLAAVLNDPSLPAAMRDTAVVAMNQLAGSRPNQAEARLVHVAQSGVAA